MKKLIMLIAFISIYVLSNAQTVTKKYVTVNGSGWKRVIYNTNNVGRGYSKVTLLTYGGNNAPHVTKIECFKGWSDYGGINIISNSAGSYWNDCRITFDGEKSYLEVYFTSDIPSLIVSLDKTEWAGANIYDGTLPDGGGATVVSSKIGRVNFGEGDFMLTYSGKIGVGTNSPKSKLDVAGTITAAEIKVQAQTADFVFEDDYQLKDLSEVEEFISTNKHLPDVPSAKQMEEDGVGLAEMNKLLLQKVEELTLYVIQQQKEISQLKAKEEKIEQLEAAIQSLINQKNDSK